MYTILSFKHIEYKHEIYRGKDCMTKYCKYLRENTINIINFKKKKKGVINKWTAKCKNLFVRKILNINMLKIKKYHKVRDHCRYTGKYKGAPYGIYNLEYCIPKKVPIVFQKKFL